MLPNNKGSLMDDPRGPKRPRERPQTNIRRELPDSHKSMNRLKLFKACDSKALRSKIASGVLARADRMRSPSPPSSLQDIHLPPESAATTALGHDCTLAPAENASGRHT